MGRTSLSKLKLFLALVLASGALLGANHWFKHSDTGFVLGHCYNVDFGALIEGAPTVQVNVLDVTPNGIIISLPEANDMMIPIPSNGGFLDLLFSKSTRVWCGF